jgi:hypothetical protein
MRYNLCVTKKEQASVESTDLLAVNTLVPRASTMTTLLDPRGAKAVAIATDAGQWICCKTRDGRKAYGIRSSRNENQVHLVTRTSCTCYDARRHDCKHQIAVRLHCELAAEQTGSNYARVRNLNPGLSRILGAPRRYTSGPFKGLPVTQRED